MKKNYFIVIIIIASILKLDGQTYFKLLEQNKRWDVTSVTCGEAPCSYITFSYKVDGDTIINNLTYFKIYDKQYELDAYRSHPTLIREDPDSMRIYRYDTFLNDDFLLYDFSITNNDSITVYGALSTVLLVVDSVTEVIINNQVRKKIVIVEDFFQNGYWIEGLGSAHGLLHPDFNRGLVDGANWLNCVHLNDSLIYMNPDVSSCNISTVSVDNVSSNRLKFPS